MKRFLLCLLLCSAVWAGPRLYLNTVYLTLHDPSGVTKPIHLTLETLAETASAPVTMELAQYVAPAGFNPGATNNTITIQNPMIGFQASAGTGNYSGTAACGPSGSTCVTPTITTVAAGAIRVMYWPSYNNNCSGSTTTDSPIGDTWVNFGYNYTGAITASMCGAYVSSSKGGSGDVVTAPVASASQHGGWYVDMTYTGTTPTISFSGANGTASSPFAGIGFSVSANSFIMQMAITSGGSITAIGGSYNLVAGSSGGRAAAYINNTSSGTAPNWTASGETSNATGGLLITQ